MTCLHPEHKKRQAVTRGLCASCYVVACRVVKSGKVTWDGLEKAGKAIGKKGKRLENYYSSVSEEGVQVGISRKFQDGALVMWGEDRVKIIGYDPKEGYEIEYDDGGAWIGNDIPESELTPIA